MGDVVETPEFLTARVDKWGSPEAYNHYAVGWAWAMDSPFQWTKQVASHWGGTRNGTIVHWPKGIEEQGGLRSQFCHVIDVAPTVLELAGIPEPTTVNGVTQSPYEGTSMVYSLNAADEAERRDTQYFEMFGNRGIYHKGWSAVTKHRTPWKLAIGTKTIPFDEDVWELYDGSKDYSQADDLSQEMPDKLKELQDLWLAEARKYLVLPLDDRGVERFSAELAGRPTIAKGRRQVFYPGMKRVSEQSVASVFLAPTELVCVGGGARGDLLLQIRADVTGLPVHRPEDVETTTRGAAMLAAVGAGLHPDVDTAAAEMAGPRRAPFLPQPEEQAVYDATYGRYRALYAALRPLF